MKFYKQVKLWSLEMEDLPERRELSLNQTMKIKKIDNILIVWW